MWRTTGPGVALAAVERWAGPYAARSKTVVAGLVSVLAPLGMPAGSGPVPVLIAVAMLGWQAGFLLLRGRFPVSVLIGVDAAVVAAACLSAPLSTVRAEFVIGNSWLAALVSFCVVTYQWQSGPWLGGAVAVLDAVAYFAGGCLQAPAQAAGFVPIVVWFLVQALLARLLLAMLRRGARAADETAAGEATERAAGAVAAARRAAERHHLASLHDTAAATLLMVGAGAIPRTAPWLRRQAGRDLRALAGTPDDAAAPRDLMLALGTPEPPVHTEVSGPATLPLPAAQVLALAGAVREALRNVARHAGVGTATLRVLDGGDAGVTVTVTDTGRGFDAGRSGRGITYSILGRLRDAGGQADVCSAPGTGTTVRLWLPAESAQRPERVDPPAHRVLPDLLPRLRIALLTITGTGLLGFYLPVALSRSSAYCPLWLEWIALAMVFAALLGAAVLPLVPGVYGRARWPLLALTLAAAELGAVAIPDRLLLGTVDWTYMVAGLLVITLLIDRPFGELALVLGVHAAVSYGRAVWLGADELVLVVGLSCVFANALGLQLTVGAVARELSRVAARAERETAARERARLRRLVEDRVHEDRRARYADVARTAGPLLGGLATGRLDAGQHDVRRACAMEAARMRRLFAESDDAADPLAHELHACADIAERRGVVVQMYTGPRTLEVPKMVRRELTEAVLALLGVTMTGAKITVTEQRRAVVVSVIGDTPEHVPLPIPERNGVVALDVVRGSRTTWLTAGWNGVLTGSHVAAWAAPDQ